MSHARAVLVVRRASGPASTRAEVCAWLRSQADYLERANDFMPTLTLRFVEREAAPQGNQFKGKEWHHGRRKGHTCTACGLSGHDRRTCSSKKPLAGDLET